MIGFPLWSCSIWKILRNSQNKICCDFDNVGIHLPGSDSMFHSPLGLWSYNIIWWQYPGIPSKSIPLIFVIWLLILWFSVTFNIGSANTKNVINHFIICYHWNWRSRISIIILGLLKIWQFLTVFNWQIAIVKSNVVFHNIRYFSYKLKLENNLLIASLWVEPQRKRLDLLNKQFLKKLPL